MFYLYSIYIFTFANNILLTSKLILEFLREFFSYVFLFLISLCFSYFIYSVQILFFCYILSNFDIIGIEYLFCNPHSTD